MSMAFIDGDLAQAVQRVRSAAQQLPECVSEAESRLLRAHVALLKDAIEDFESAVTECDLNDLERTS